jgi:hypothetical protein
MRGITSHSHPNKKWKGAQTGESAILELRLSRADQIKALHVVAILFRMAGHALSVAAVRL